MCSNMVKNKKIIQPGALIMSYNKVGTSFKSFGNHDYWNARSEKLNTTYRNYDKGCILINGFFEGAGYFRRSDSIWLHLATVEDERSILILTMNSYNTPVEKFHHRTPLILKDPRKFIMNGIIELIDYKTLKVAV